VSLAEYVKRRLSVVFKVSALHFIVGVVSDEAHRY
jgi:hypothetical protein